MWHNLAENIVYFVGIGENAAATVFGSNTPHGAAYIPVNFIVANVVEAVSKFSEFYRLFAQYLWDYGDGDAVGFRQHIVYFFPSFSKIAVSE